MIEVMEETEKVGVDIEATIEVEEVVVDIPVVDTEVVMVVTKEITKENLIPTTKLLNKLKKNIV